MYREPTRGHQWRAYPRSLPPSTTPVVVDWLSTLITRGWGLPPRQRLCVVAIALGVVSILATTFLVQLIIVAVVASFLALRELIITTSIVPWQQRIRFCDESKDLLDRAILIEELRKKGWDGMDGLPYRIKRSTVSQSGLKTCGATSTPPSAPSDGSPTR